MYPHTNLVYACIKENLQALALGSNTAPVVHVVCVLENVGFDMRQHIMLVRLAILTIFYIII